MKNLIGSLARLAVLATAFTGVASSARAVTTCTFTTDGNRMKLNADCTTDTTILIPNGFTLDGRGHVITAVDPPGDHWRGAVIRNAGPRANVRSVTITTSGLQDVCDFGAGTFGEDRLRGIAFYSASGTIRGNRIIGLHQGPGSICNEGTAILVENPPFDGTRPATLRATVEENEIIDVQQYGVSVQGDVDVTVEENRVTLSDRVGLISQYGLAAASGATARMVQNIVRGGYADGRAFFPTGVLIFETSRVHVTGNLISGVQDGIFAQSWCLRAPVANRNVIAGNFIRGAAQGVLLVARSVTTSLCDPHVDQNHVSFNAIVSAPGTTPLTGVFYGRQVFGGTFTPVADGNVITFNLISGYQNPLFDSGSTNSVVSDNRIR